MNKYEGKIFHYCLWKVNNEEILGETGHSKVFFISVLLLHNVIFHMETK